MGRIKKKIELLENSLAFYKVAPYINCIMQLIEGVTMQTDQFTLFRQKIRRIERELQSHLKEDDTCCGVSMAQCHVIMELGLVDETSISNLADILKLDKSTLSRTVDGLVKTGLVDRTIDEKDRRFMVVKLTEQGTKFYLQIDSSCNDLYQRVFAQIPQNRRDQVIEGVALLADAFSRIRSQMRTCETNTCQCNVNQEEN